MFDSNELQQLGYFLLQATLKGSESTAHANLLYKIQRLIDRAQASVPVSKEQE